MIQLQDRCRLSLGRPCPLLCTCCVAPDTMLLPRSAHLSEQFDIFLVHLFDDSIPPYPVYHSYTSSTKVAEALLSPSETRLSLLVIKTSTMFEAFFALARLFCAARSLRYSFELRSTHPLLF